MTRSQREGTASLGSLEANHEVRFTRQRKCRRGAGLPEVASSLSPGPQGFVSLLHAKYTCPRPRSLKASPRLSAPSPEFIKSAPWLEEAPENPQLFAQSRVPLHLWARETKETGHAPQQHVTCNGVAGMG